MRKFAPALALAVLLAGCSSAGATESLTPDGSLTRSSSGPAAASDGTAPPPAATTSELDAIVLTTADVPAGWVGRAHKAEPTPTGLSSPLANCVGVVDSSPEELARAHSDDFTSGFSSIYSSAIRFRSHDAIVADLAMFSHPRALGCFEEFLTKSYLARLPAGATVSAHVALTPGSGTGPVGILETMTAEVTIADATRERSVVYYLSTTIVAGPMVEAEIDTIHYMHPPDASEMPSLVAAVTSRMAQS